MMHCIKKKIKINGGPYWTKFEPVFRNFTTWTYGNQPPERLRPSLRSAPFGSYVLTSPYKILSIIEGSHWGVTEIELFSFICLNSKVYLINTHLSIFFNLMLPNSDNLPTHLLSDCTINVSPFMPTIFTASPFSI